MEKRWLLFFLITFIAVEFYIISNRPQKKEGNKEISAVSKDSSTSQEDNSSTQSASVRTADRSSEDEKEIEKLAEETKKENLTLVLTNKSNIVFTDRGARPSIWENTETKYLEEMKDGKKYPVQVIPQDNKFFDRELPLEVNFKEYNSRSYNELNEVFYTLEESTNAEGSKVLTYTSPVINELQLIKTYTIPNDKYYIDLDIKLINLSQSNIRIEDDKKGLSISWGPGIGRFDSLDKNERPFIGAYYSTDDGMQFNSPKVDKPIEDSRKTYWGGLESKYFFTAVFPRKISENDKKNFHSSRILVRNRNIQPKYVEHKYPNYPITIEFFEEGIQLDSGKSIEYGYRIYAAPKNYSSLKKEDYPVSEILFHNSYSWMRWLCMILLKTLNWFNHYVKNYGIAIILLTIFIKIITHPLTHKGMKLQAKAMAEQEKIRPYIEEIQKKHKDNPQKRNAEMMKLYKEHGINPFGMLRGCIPMLIQMPIFFAFYKLLNQSIDLKNQGFLWINDLSRPDALFHFGSSLPILGDSFNLLPLLMGVSQFFVSKISATNIKDPMQRQMMIMMPLVFIFILYSFPSGLILYWFIQNIWQFTHQLITNKLIKKEKK